MTLMAPVFLRHIGETFFSVNFPPASRHPHRINETQAQRIAIGRLAEPLFKRLLLDNHLTPLNPIALKCSSRARVHELVLLSPLSASDRKRDRDREIQREGEKEKDGKGGLNSRTRLVRVGKVRESLLKYR